MGGRHAAPQAHSTNVMCHVPAGTPTVPYARGGRPGRPSAHGVPGVAESPHGETNPGWRAMCPSPNRAGTSEAERCYRVNGATPCAVHRGRLRQYTGAGGGKPGPTPDVGVHL